MSVDSINCQALKQYLDDEKRFVTGQNQNSGHETAQRIMKIIEESS